MFQYLPLLKFQYLEPKVGYLLVTNLLFVNFYTDTDTDFNKPTAMVVWTDPLSADNSELAPTVTCNEENGSHFDIGETEVIYHALDQAGNQATCTFNVYVKGTLLKKYMLLL